MYIHKIISNLNAWQELTLESKSLFSEIEEAIKKVSVKIIQSYNDRLRTPKEVISLQELNKDIKAEFWMYGWTERNLNTISRNSGNRFLRSIDLIKGTLGVEIFFGKQAFLESLILVKIPSLIDAKIFKTAIIILPIKEMEARSHPPVTAHFEGIRDVLTEYYTESIKYPFLIIGISDKEPGKIEITELNTELDNYLINRLGMSLNELLLHGESDNVDFKEIIITNDKLTKQACAFANTPNGGILIFGIQDDKTITGVPDDQWDEYQTRIANIVSSCCTPTPEFKLFKFDMGDEKNKVFVLDLQELGTKPCVANDHRVYIRKGGTTRPAGSEDIRRMILR